jgi:hypothetical protein
LWRSETFRLDSCHGEFVASLAWTETPLVLPQRTEIDGMLLAESSASAAPDPLYLDSGSAPQAILHQTPGLFRLIGPHDTAEFLDLQRPFFFQDTAHTYFVGSGCVPPPSPIK